jgi:O-antigen ligase/tetratricopeptide (TPR) repeat protein
MPDFSDKPDKENSHFADNRKTGDLIIEMILIALYLLMPIALGGVKAWSKEAAIILTGAALLVLLFKKIYSKDCQISRTSAYIPVIIFTAIVVMQLTALPTKIVEYISPNTAALKTQLSGDLENAKDALKTMTLSFYSNATKHDLRLLLAAGALFFVVLNYCGSIIKVKRILTAIACIGGLVAAAALIQNIFGNGKIFWFIESKGGREISGPFVNHSHYGQFINLSTGAAIGVILAEVSKNIARLKSTAEVFEYLGSKQSRKFWLMAAIIILGVTTLFLSLTRGGMLSMLAAIFLITLIGFGRNTQEGCRFGQRKVEKSRYGKSLIMAVTALAAFGCIVYTGFDAVYERFATIWHINPYQDRLQIVQDMTINFKRFPVFGTGMGTHSVVYPMTDSSNLTTLCTHAENEYAQVMEETGIAGLAALVILGIIIGKAFFKNTGSKDATIRALSYGTGFGLTAILIHSLSDFGQHIPANTFLAVTYCAMLISLANIDQNRKGITITNKLKLIPVTALFISAGVWMWAIMGADNARRAYADWENVKNTEKQLIKNNWQGSDEEYGKLISFAKEAVTAENDNAIYRYWYNVYRWRNECRTDKGLPNSEEQTEAAASDIVKELDKVRQLCPTFGATYCVQGQIEKSIFGIESGLEKIHKGFLLAPCDPIVCFTAGAADIEEENIERSVEEMKKAVELREDIFRDAADIYVKKINQPAPAIEIAGDNIDRLGYLKEIFSGNEEYKEYAKEVERHLIEVLEKECSRADASTIAILSLANIYKQQPEKKTFAAELYRRAVSRDYAAVDIRLNLARILAETGKKEDAIRESRICLKLRPQSKEAENLLAELSVQKATTRE